MNKIIVIGGGPAGMFAAIAAAETGSQVILLEKNEKLGKKLFITGKGRCNITNAGDMDNLFANVMTNAKFLYSAFYSYDNQRVIDFFERNGLRTKTERGNRVFPVSDHSSDVIGYRQPQLNSWNRRTEMYGWSFFEWDYTREHPAGATHRIAGFLEAHNGVHLDDGYSEEMEYKAAALSEDMTVFPAEGSIVEEKDLVVVKLSEITERPAVDWW